MKQTLLLIVSALVSFAGVAFLMVRLMPDPLQDSDYLVIGSVSTLVAMLAVFVVLISTKLKTSDLFFKRRKKQ